MARSPLGKTLVIANPAAHSGDGERGARFAETFLESFSSATNGFEVRRTKCMGDAEVIAAQAASYDTVVALGGDGVIHEVVNGLMKLRRPERPQLGVIPLGSGNDFARTLGMPRNNVGEALSQLVRGQARSCELGRVNDVYYMQTLSFGLDAAIALDTTDKRAEGTNQKGEELFARSALRILSHASKGYACTATFDDEEPIELSSTIFAVQVGPTYGGGFRICPDADPADGLLDVCYNVKLPSTPRLLALLGFARAGKHTMSNVVETKRIHHAELAFIEEPPCQVDGEKLEGTSFAVDVVPDALDVIFPQRR